MAISSSLSSASRLSLFWLFSTLAPCFVSPRCRSFFLTARDRFPSVAISSFSASVASMALSDSSAARSRRGHRVRCDSSSPPGSCSLDGASLSSGGAGESGAGGSGAGRSGAGRSGAAESGAAESLPDELALLGLSGNPTSGDNCFSMVIS
eukprot:3131368-Prymnesium_polylepis.1